VILAATSSQALWYLTRGSGLVALVLLTGSMALGIAQFERWLGPTGQRFVVTQVHRNVSLLAVVFLGVHVATTVVDGFAPITWLDAVVPFASPYRSLWLGFGALALDLLLAVTVTSLLRTHMSYPAWRAVHWTAYLCWPLAFVHGLGTGSDARVGWVQLLDVVCLAVVVAAVVWRLAVGWRPHAPARAAAAATTVALLLLVGGWAWAGPLRDGWAQKAGTPSSLLGTSGAGTTTGTGG
jgi:predicted ferric reductase